MLKVSPNFYWEEATVTQQRGLDNTPPLVAIPSLVMVFNEQMEQVRALLDCPIHINSGFRSIEVNAAVGGAATSQHCKGQAVDWTPMKEVSLKEAYDAIVASNIVFDQLIYEFGSWLHISRPGFGETPRASKLMIGKWTDGKYATYDSSSIP
jgi:zinc D-Ala-D-Ala carboxypeptidase